MNISNDCRFSDNHECRCTHILDGSCKQCSACTDCKYFCAPISIECNSSYVPIPGFHVWGGQFRNNEFWRKTH